MSGQQLKGQFLRTAFVVHLDTEERLKWNLYLAMPVSSENHQGGSLNSIRTTTNLPSQRILSRGRGQISLSVCPVLKFFLRQYGTRDGFVWGE